MEDGADERLSPARRRAGLGSLRGGKTPPQQQLSLISATPAALESLLGLDIASMTPLEAINKLYELQEQAKDGG